jgi:tetratricopeptide (TPR) repeat protein
LLAVIERGLAIDPALRWPSIEALLEALLDDPIHRRRRRVAATGAALLLGALAAGAWGVEAQAVARCEDAGAAIEAGWNAASRAELEHVFVGSGASNATEVWARFEAQVDDWTADWRAARISACLDARKRDVERPAPREVCLERQRWQLDAVLEVFATVDAAMVQRSVNAVAALPSVSHCSEPGWLASERGLAQVDTQEEQLREQLVRVFVLEGAGRTDEALALAKTSFAVAEALGDVALEAEARRNLGGMRWRMGDYERAEHELRAAYFMAGGIGHDRVALEAAEELLLVLGLGRARYDEAHEWAEHMRMVIRRMGLDPERDYPPLFAALGRLDAEEGVLDQALAAHRRALGLLRERLDADHPDIAIALNYVGQVQVRLGDYEQALITQHEALTISARALGPRHPYTLTIREAIAVILGRLGRPDQAITEHRATLELQAAVLGPEHPEVATTLNNLAAALRDTGDYAEAATLLERALPIYERVHGPKHPKVAALLGNLASATAKLGEPRRAIELLERALEIKQTALGPEHPSVATTLVSLGMRQQELGDFDGALASFTRAVAIDELTIGREHPDYAADLDSLGSVLHALGDVEGALARHQQAFEIRERVLPEDHPDRAASHDFLGVLARDRGELELAIAQHRRALELREAAHGPEHRLLATSLINLGHALAAAGERDQARAAFERAVTIAKAAEGGLPIKAAEALEGLARLD